MLVPLLTYYYLAGRPTFGVKDPPMQYVAYFVFFLIVYNTHLCLLAKTMRKSSSQESEIEVQSPITPPRFITY